MANIGAVVPPEKNDDPCFLGLLVCPESWVITVASCLDQLARGRYWRFDGEQGSVIRAKKVGREIADSFMTCDLKSLVKSVEEIEYTLKHLVARISDDKTIKYKIDKPAAPLVEGDNPDIEDNSLSVFEAQLSLLGFETERVNLTQLIETALTDNNSIPLPDLNPFNIKSKVDTTNSQLATLNANLAKLDTNLSYIWKTFTNTTWVDINPTTNESFFNLFRRSLNEQSATHYLYPAPFTEQDKAYLLNSYWLRHSLSEIEYTLKYIHNLFHTDNKFIESITAHGNLPTDSQLLRYFRGDGAPMWPTTMSTQPSVFTLSEPPLLLSITEIINRLSSVISALNTQNPAPNVSVTVDTQAIANKLDPLSFLSNLQSLTGLASLANLANLTNLASLTDLSELQKIDGIVSVLTAIKDCVCNPPEESCEAPALDLSKEGVTNEATDTDFDGEFRCKVAVYIYDSILDLLNSLIYWFDVLAVLFDVPSALLAAALTPLLVKFTFLSRWTGEGVILTKGATKMGMVGAAGSILLLAELISWLASVDKLALEAFRDWWVERKELLICGFILRKDKDSFVAWLAEMLESYPDALVLAVKSSIIGLISLPVALSYTIYQLSNYAEIPAPPAGSCVCTDGKIWVFREYSGDGETCRNIKFTKQNLSTYTLIFDSDESDVSIEIRDVVVTGDNWSAKMCYTRLRYQYFNAILEIRFQQ